MSMQMADPYHGLVSFQQGLRAGILNPAPVKPYKNLYSHFDVSAPGVQRLTYVRLNEHGKTVTAFPSCVMNGQVDGYPCVAFGYAVPEDMRNRGFAKAIVRDAMQDQAVQAARAGHSAVYIEAVVDIANLASQRAAEAVLGAPREEIVDRLSTRQAYRYTRRLDTIKV
jgi:hypothetical protein